MKEYYFTTMILTEGGVEYSTLQKADVSTLDPESLELLHNNGFLTFLNLKLSAVNFVGNYEILAELRKMFILGIELSLADEKEKFFKNYILKKYDNTVDCMNKLNRDPVFVDLQYVK